MYVANGRVFDSGANFRDANVQLSEFLGIRQQAAGSVPSTPEHKRAAAAMKSTLAHPECWEKDVNDSDMCCGGPLTAPGAPQDKAWVLFSPSSQGSPPHPNCSTITPPLEKTNFNGAEPLSPFFCRNRKFEIHRRTTETSRPARPYSYATM